MTPAEKPFALFLGDDYYPDGGWRDFVGFFTTMDEAVAAAVEPEEEIKRARGSTSPTCEPGRSSRGHQCRRGIDPRTTGSRYDRR